MATVDLTAATLREAIACDGIVLVEFWADWCGPCRQFGPVFEEASKKHTDAVFGKVDTEARIVEAVDPANLLRFTRNEDSSRSRARSAAHSQPS